MKEFFYVTCATGENHIKEYAQYALKSLLKCRVPGQYIYCLVNNENDLKVLNELIPKYSINIGVANINIDNIKWKAHNGKRKYSVFKSGALYKMFPKPIVNQTMVYFDTDVLFFKDPQEFLDSRSEKTWFHHGKILKDVCIRKSRAGKLINKEDVNINDYESLRQWVSKPAAFLMIKHKCKRLPDREVCAGFFILHRNDHSKLLKLTYENCLYIVSEFKDDVDVGDQKPLNAALNILEIDFHGGNRLECPEHLEYFNHFFGVKNQKTNFYKKVKELNL
jgi:hypothetical protein